MSDQIKHECGIALIRLLKPLGFYQKKYGTPLYGLEKLRLLLQKQRNRGQDGAGMATIKLDIQPGKKYISRKRSVAANYLQDLFDQIFWHFQDLPENKLNDPEWLKENKPDHLQDMETGVRRPKYRFWQDGGGYDRNYWEPVAIRDQLAYIHANPVRRGIVKQPEDWYWSSASEWVYGKPGPIAIDKDSFPIG